ncbi:MAG: DNA adenine methylase [Pyrinomonadaceae bacterium]
MIGSPLRYPGGKTKALTQIAPLLPARFHSYREPFVGGGSLFINLTQQRPDLPIWINDLNYDLYCFWQTARTDLAKLTAAVCAVKARAPDGRKLFADLTTNCRPEELSVFERAVRFFVLNRITFSGTVEAGGYSQKAFESRFTDSSIERLARLTHVLTPDVRVTNLDYEQLLTAPGRAVCIFLDPPYLSATKSKLYGRKGALHTNFDHARFARLLQACRHKWLITYDDSPEVRRNFAFSGAHIYEWQLQYGMNNFGRTYAPKGKELFITNYPVEESARAAQPASGR